MENMDFFLLCKQKNFFTLTKAENIYYLGTII